MSELPLFQAVSAARASVRNGTPLDIACEGAAKVFAVDAHAVAGYVRIATTACDTARHSMQSSPLLTEDTEP